MKLVDRATESIFNGKLKYLSRFSMIGIANTLIDFVVFTIVHVLYGVNYTSSQALGYGFGVANSFIFNRKWTFEDRNVDKKVFHELLQFIVVNLISLLITMITINLLIENLNLNVYISKIIVTVIAQITNFLAYKLWVFKQVK